MARLESLLKSKAVILFLLSLPGWRLVFQTLTDDLGANPLEYLLLQLGKSAITLLVITLWFSPLRLFFPQAPLVKIVLRHRRWVGVSSFVYALAHLSLYLLDTFDLAELLKNLQKPFILFGMGGFFILLLMASTSTNAAVRKLGAPRWKQLHRLVYVAAVLLCLHMVLKQKGDLLKGFLWFGPLALAEAYRVWHWWRTNHQPLRTPSDTKFL